MSLTKPLVAFALAAFTSTWYVSALRPETDARLQATPEVEDLRVAPSVGAPDSDLQDVVSMLASFAQNDAMNASKDEKDEMVKYIKNITAAHTAELNKKTQAAQDNINGKLDLFSACSQNFTSAVAQDKASYMGDQGSVVTWREKHSTCRASLKTIDGDRSDVCAELADFLELLKKDPPQCGLPDEPEDLVKYFHDLQTYVHTMKGLAASEYEACETKTNETTAKLADCGSDQGELEKSVCDYRAQVHATCAEQAGCYGKALAAFNTASDNVKTAKESIEFEHSLIATLECLLEVIKSEKPHNEREAASDICMQGTTVTVNITIPAVPDNHVCNYTEVSKFPCSYSYTSEMYKDMVHIHECKACGTLPVYEHFTEDTMKSVGSFSGGVPGGNRQCTGVIAAGHQHVCAGNAMTGKLECSGDNGHGELGPHGMDLSDVKQLTVGADCTFVLKSNGEIGYYGTNSQGQQNGGATPENGKEIWSITALSYSLLVRFVDNTWTCYGRTDECGPVRDFMNNEKQVKYIAQMRHGACVIKMDDTVWCGVVHHGVNSIPADLGEVSALNCGCCWCVAVRKSDGRLKAWGYNGHGEVSQANGGVYQAEDKWVNPRSLVCEYHTCYAISENGEAQRWGWGGGGTYWSPSQVTDYIKEYPDTQFVSTGPDGHQFLLWSPSAKKLEGFGHNGGNAHDGAKIGSDRTDFELADSSEQCKVFGAGKP